MTTSDIASDDVIEPRVARRERVKFESSDTVIVGCKLPNGLEIFDEVEEGYRDQVFGGGFRELTRFRRVGPGYVLKGSAINIAAAARGDVPHLIIGGYGFTPGIPRDFWERWVARHAKDDIVAKEMVIARSSEGDLRKQALDNRKLRSGLEPIDAANPGIATGTRSIRPGTRAEVDEA